MCTLSWRLTENKYEVFFNRDEQRSRAKATVPRYDDNTNSIYPLDPHGGGTWISVNRSGLTLCLLNNYQAQSENKDISFRHSRGQIILKLTGYDNAKEIESMLRKLDLGSYAPFLLCIFTQSLITYEGGVPVFSWNGKSLNKSVQKQPLISSSVSLEEVTANRQSLFSDMVLDVNADTESHLNYHCSHSPDRGKLSVCMHRSDAATQSLSHIAVAEHIKFSYHDGSPCKNSNWSDMLMPPVTMN